MGTYGRGRSGRDAEKGGSARGTQQTAIEKRKAGAVSLLALTAEYLILRYPLFKLHGMMDWPWILFLTGIVVIAVSGLVKGKKALPVLTAAGYIVGFFLGYLFQFDYGRELNSLWIIWTVCYAAAILAGVFITIPRRVRNV